MAELSLDHVAVSSALSLTSSVAYQSTRDKEAESSFDDHLQRASNAEQPREDSSANLRCADSCPREDLGQADSFADDSDGAVVEDGSEYQAAPALAESPQTPTAEEPVAVKPVAEQPAEESQNVEANAEAPAVILVLPQVIDPSVAKIATSEVTTADAERVAAATKDATTALTPKDAKPVIATRPFDGQQVGTSTTAVTAESTEELDKAAVTEAPQAAAKEIKPRRAEPISQEIGTAEAEQPQVAVRSATEEQEETAEDQDSERRPREKNSNAGKQAEGRTAEAVAVAQESKTATIELPSLLHGEAPPADAVTLEQSLPVANEAQAKGPTEQPATTGVAGPGRAHTNLSAKLATHDTQTATAGSEVDRVRFVQRVARAFQAADEQGGQIRLRLSPPELGAMRLEVAVRDGVMTARMETETAAARNLLLEHLPALRDRLAEQNIKVDRFDVDVMGRQSGGSPEHSAESGNQRPRPAPQVTRNAPSSASATAGAAATGGRERTGNTQLNIIV